MFAVIETGGKQYKVSAGDVIDVEKLDAKEGDIINPKVLLFEKDGKVLTGDPVPKIVVEAQVLKTFRDKKIIVYKYKAKKNVRKKQGHRQSLTKLKITTIG